MAFRNRGPVDKVRYRNFRARDTVEDAQSVTLAAVLYALVVRVGWRPPNGCCFWETLTTWGFRVVEEGTT